MKTGKRIHCQAYWLLILLLMTLSLNFLYADVTDVNKDLKEKQKTKILENEKKNDPQSFMLEKDKITDEQKRQELEAKRLHLCFEKIKNLLISKGYQTDNVPFKMRFKNIIRFKFNNRAYLNHKKLPKEITKEIFKIYNDTCKQTRTITISLPEGLKSCDDCPELKE